MLSVQRIFIPVSFVFFSSHTYWFEILPDENVDYRFDKTDLKKQNLD